YRFDLVQTYYLRFLHRRGSVQEMSGFVNSLAGGATDESVEAAIFGSAEYSMTNNVAIINGDSTALVAAKNGAFLDDIYRDLGTPNTTKAANLTNLGNGASRNSVAANILHSADFCGAQVE